ncbi:MAG TPA: helix-turn-helix domain-containing protein [Gemmatimonadales bacterium]|nr:helix-turn-helix domain-containing protein [Gemmatimonadales bacterium]
MATRKYEQKRRAELQGETRQRIVEAMVALHRELGPARTTISAIAERAGVERLTVYRHFDGESAMFEACSAHFAAEVPPPDPAVWQGVEDPAERLRAALLAFYDYYGRAEEMLAKVHRDVPLLPALAAVLAPWEAFVAAVRDGLVGGWRTRGAARARLVTAVSHALRFETWQSLRRADALRDADAADLMVTLAQAVAAAGPLRGPAQRRGGRTRSR